MRTTQQFSITLPLDMAEAIERKVRSGAYASVSEVVRDGVRALLERDAAVERWLCEEVVPGHQEYLADPSKGVPADAVLKTNEVPARRTQPLGLFVEVIFTPLAERHLDALHQYVTTRSGENRADEYVGRIVEFCKSLTTFPMRGTPRDDLLPGLRVTGFEGASLLTSSSPTPGCSSKALSMAAATSRRDSVRGARTMIPSDSKRSLSLQRNHLRNRVRPRLCALPSNRTA